MAPSKLRFSEEQRGSATSEFVLLALPLFVPALIFFASISQVSRAEMEGSMLAREALKAFTTGQDDREGHLRVRLLLNQYSELSTRGANPGSSRESGVAINDDINSGQANLNQGNSNQGNSNQGNSYQGNSNQGNSKEAGSTNSEPSRSSRIEYSLRCSTSPCILPGAEVEITLFSIVDLGSEIDSLTKSPSSFWGSDQTEIARQRIVIASARGFVDKWR